MSYRNECIDEVKSGYRVRIGYYDDLGIRRFYSKSFAIKKYGTKQRALEYARKHRDEIKVKLANGLIVKEKHYSLDQIYMEQMSIYNTTLATKKKVEGTYNKYIKSYIGGDRLFSSIKFDDIQKCLNSMVDIAKDDTIQRAKAIWGRMYRYAIAKNIVMKDETYNVNTPKSNILSIKKSMEISDEDFIKAISMINNSTYNYREKQLVVGALLIMRYEGMRPSEVLGLEKKNIDMNNMTIYVCQRVGSSSTEWDVITHTKTESSIRYLPIDKRLVGVFNKLIEMTEGDYIFTKNNGKLMNGTYLSDVCRNLTKGLLRPYMLRHQFSTDMVIEGVDIRTIQELMGHTSSTMTIGYARSNDELKRKALECRILH